MTPILPTSMLISPSIKHIIMPILLIIMPILHMIMPIVLIIMPILMKAFANKATND